MLSSAGRCSRERSAPPTLLALQLQGLLDSNGLLDDVHDVTGLQRGTALRSICGNPDMAEQSRSFRRPIGHTCGVGSGSGGSSGLGGTSGSGTGSGGRSGGCG